ncbi:hypothetical protein SMD10_24695 [Consotaella sp. CSK11QG-6]
MGFIPALSLIIPLGVDVYAQTSTPLSQNDENNIVSACRTIAPKFVDMMCIGKANINTVSLNFPNICNYYNSVETIKVHIEACKSPTSDLSKLYVEMWRYSLGMKNSFYSIYSDYVSGNVAAEVAAAAPAISGAEQAFTLSIIACGRDEGCNRDLFESLSKTVKASLVKTPLFCDYDDSRNIFKSDRTYRSIFVDERYPDGLTMPVCKEYYCKYHNCDKLEVNNGLFILGDRFIPQYDLLFKGIQP